MSPESLHGKHVVVLGLARQGKALARWLPEQGAQVTISDLRSADDLTDDIVQFAWQPVRFVLGSHPLELLNDCDLLCVSGGVPLSIPIVREALRRNIPVVNDAQLFLERCPAPVLGITGSAGKTTTTALVGAMCRAAGYTTWVGGNIGEVLLDVLDEISPDDRVVMELSSFQLELMTTSPGVAAVLNVTPNHLDRHGTMPAYIAAKSNIFLHQDHQQIAIFGLDDPNARSMSRHALGRVGYFSRVEAVPCGAYLHGDQLVVDGDCVPGNGQQVVCDRSAIKLRGQHNLLNVLAACAIAGAGGVPVDAMRAAIERFTGVDHRQEPVATIDGVLWVNDSIATAPERVLAALRSYDKPLVLLAGGRDKKLPWDELAALAVQTCRAVIAFGEFSEQVAAQVQQAQTRRADSALENVVVVENLDAAVYVAADLAQPGDVVLLSPGGTSYDAYVDFAARGQHFRDLVRALESARA
ncbi:MAG: UDP-N-acetylmuramoyl-L-alanine--D-glutamate ligase [Chloroflexi bacterium]|nr:UDP-N-acetylmuramoyl-L-alanine--D-glutamate ligase [Chloroflexota bacterium]